MLNKCLISDEHGDDASDVIVISSLSSGSCVHHQVTHILESTKINCLRRKISEDDEITFIFNLLYYQLPGVTKYIS